MADDIVRVTSIRPDSIINDVTVDITPNPLQPTPTDQNVTDTTSQDNYGVQSITLTLNTLRSCAWAV